MNVINQFNIFNGFIQVFSWSIFMSNYFYPMNTNDLFNLFNAFIFVNRQNGLLLMMPCSLLSQNIVNREKPWFLLISFIQLISWSLFMSNYISPMNANHQFNLFNACIFVNRHNCFLPMMPCSLVSQNIVNRGNPWFLLRLHILNFGFMFCGWENVN